MAVETRYVVIRADKSNKEQEVMTFTDKRAADEYDKMLDMADNLFELLNSSGLDVDDQQAEAMSIFLAKQREEVLIALQAKKKPVAKKASVKKASNDLDDSETSNADAKEPSAKKSASEESSESHQASSEDTLVDFVIEKDDAA
jgi:uncharacterized protein